MTLVKTVKLDQFCKSIMTSDRNVLSVSIIDHRGTVVHNDTQRGISQPRLDRWNDIHYMECTFDISMGARFDNFYGPIRYHYSDKDNFMMFSFPYYKNVVIVTSTKKISPIALATKISHVITDSIKEPKEKRV
jgi:hypothetical protein